MENQVVKFFGPQYDAFNFTTQFGLAVAGVQSGKTFLGAHWAGKKMQEFPKGRGIIVAPTYKIVQSATLAKLFEVFPALRKNYKEQKGEIVLPTGGSVFIRSADKPLGIEGITADWVWLDEGGQAGVLTWTVLRSRVSMTRGQILITTTPYNMGWLYTDFYVPWRDKEDKELSVYTWRSVDNPHYSREFFDAERKRLPPEEFARRYMGEFKKMSGLVWDIPPEAIIRPDESLKKAADARIMGIDWGFRNPAAIIVVYKVEDNYYVTDEWKQAEKINSEILQVAQNMAKDHRVFRIYPDPAEPDRLEEARRAHIPVYEANKDVTGGCSYIRQLIHEGRLFVFNTCKEFIDEASMYHYPEPKDDVHKPEDEKPEKVNDHLCDAFRYAVYSYKPVNRKPKASPPLKPYYESIGF